MVKMIWCEDINHGIGKDNKLPWHIPKEMKHFQKTTTGGVVLMGYKTYQSIGKPLANRTNVVVTRKHKNENINGVIFYSSLKKAIMDFSKHNLFIIGGKTIFEQALPYAHELIVSYLPTDYQCDVKLKIKLDDFVIDKEINDDSNEFKIIHYKRKPESISLTDQNNDEELITTNSETIFNLKFDNFSGPFDLLLSLIQEKKMDILNLDLALLTKQYLMFLKKHINDVNIEQVTDYLVTATYLIELKSKKIIPIEQDQFEIDIENKKERDRLVKRLIEYKRYREVLPTLEELRSKRFSLFAKEIGDWKVFQPDPGEIIEAPLPEYVNPMKLYLAMQKVLERTRNKLVPNQTIVIKEFSTELVQAEIYEIIKNCNQKRISMTRILNSVDYYLKVNLMYFVTCFFVLLVLANLHKINLYQTRHNAEIYAELADPKLINQQEETAEEMIKRQEEFKREVEEYKKQRSKERALNYYKQREEYLKKKYGDAYVSREEYLKMTPEQRAALKIKQDQIKNSKDKQEEEK